MPRFVLLGGRVYALRFTLRSVLLTQEIAGVPFSTLFHSGPAGLSLLLFSALLDAHPAVTPAAAAALVSAAAGEDSLDALTDALLSAFSDSGLETNGVSRSETERLIAAACRSGYPHPERLPDMTAREISLALDGFCARERPVFPSSMTDQQMKDTLVSLARRCHEHS